MLKTWLVPKFEIQEDNTRATIFVYTLFLCAILLLSLYIINSFFDLNSGFPFISMFVAICLLLLLFKITKSFQIIGNIISALIAISIFNLSLKTGGIFSEDTHALFIVPVIAFVISGKRSGLFWIFIAAMLILYHYFQAGTAQEINYFRSQTDQFNKTYYLVISLIALILTTIPLFIFKIQYEKLITKLEKNREYLQDKKNKLQETQTKLEISNKELDQYAHTTAHDLKQPIRTIYSFTGLLKKELEKNKLENENTKEYIDIIQKSSKNMNQLITDLLEFSQLSNKTLKTEVDLNLIVEDVKISLKNLIEKTSTVIDNNKLPTIEGVPIQIFQLLQNLISNAIKFKKNNTSPKITIESTEGPNYFTISVTDNGIGINPVDSTKIFTPFKKLHHTSEYEGSGIGLATCKKIIENHKGKIWVESKLDFGSTFYFTLKK